MRVLIALSTTEQSREIVQEAAGRPWPANSKFLLLHVLDPFPFAQLLRSNARRRLRAKSWRVRRKNCERPAGARTRM